MKEPTKQLKFELRLLKESAKGLTDIPLTVINKQRIIKIAKIVGFLLMLTCFLTTGYLKEYPIVSILIAAFSGSILGFGIIAEMLIEQYPYIAKHINSETLEARIKEIEKEIGQ